MSPRRRDRSDARERNLTRRKRQRTGETEARIVTCPDCRGHIRVRPGGDDPEICGSCESRLLCGTCGVELVQFTEEEREEAGGDCPRCGDPLDGTDRGPGSEEFTWNER